MGEQQKRRKGIVEDGKATAVGRPLAAALRKQRFPLGEPKFFFKTISDDYKLSRYCLYSV